MKKQLTTFSAPFIVILLASSTLAQNKDIIWRIGGADMVSGEIRSVSPDFITIVEQGESQKISVDKVSKIRFRDDPSGFASVRSEVETGQLEQARAQMRSIQPAGRPFVRQEVSFYRALIHSRLALQGKSPINDAAREMGSFLKSYSASFRFYEACEVMGDLAMSLGRFDSAAKYYARLSDSKSTSIAARSKLLQGDAWLRQGDPQKALPLFQETAAARDVRLQGLGQIGVASCLAQTGKAEEAVAQIEKVLLEHASTDGELFARAYNALGYAFVASGKKEAALEAFLHTDLLFHRQSEQHAESLYHLAKLWTDVKKPAEAARARQTLKQAYGASLWAKK